MLIVSGDITPTGQQPVSLTTRWLLRLSVGQDDERSWHVCARYTFLKFIRVSGQVHIRSCRCQSKGVIAPAVCNTHPRKLAAVLPARRVQLSCKDTQFDRRPRAREEATNRASHRVHGKRHHKLVLSASKYLRVSCTCRRTSSLCLTRNGSNIIPWRLGRGYVVGLYSQTAIWTSSLYISRSSDVSRQPDGIAQDKTRLVTPHS